MLFTIIKKEILLNLVSFRFMVSVVLLSVLIVGSMQIMAINYSRRLEDYSMGVQMHKNDMANISTRPEFEAFGVTKDPRPPMLGIFAIGLEKQMSRSFMIPGYSMTREGEGGRVVYSTSKLIGIMPEGSKYSNPVFTLFMPPDFIYIINIVLSLLALLFSFDCISGEKEDQTLKLMLTNSVPRDVILFGKWIGGTISIMLPFLAAFSLGILLVVLRKDVSFTGEAPVRIALILGASMLYIAVFFLLGLLFSAFTERSSTSLILSLFAWVFFVLVIPNISPVIARQIVPLKTPDQIVRESERIEEDLRHEAMKEQNEEKRKELWEKMKEDVPKKVRALEERWLNGLQRQTAMAANISRISPSANYVYITTSVAGTGLADYIKQKEEIFRYRSDLSSARNKFLKSDKSKPIPVLYVKIDQDKVPVFQEKGIEWSDSVNNVIWDFVILFAYLAVFFMVTFIRFLNYDVK